MSLQSVVASNPTAAAAELANMFDLDKSVCAAVLKENGMDVDKAVDHLLTIQSLGAPDAALAPSIHVSTDDREKRAEAVRRFLAEQSVLKQRENEQRLERLHQDQERLRAEQERREALKLQQQQDEQWLVRREKRRSQEEEEKRKALAAAAEVKRLQEEKASIEAEAERLRQEIAGFKAQQQRANEARDKAEDANAIERDLKRLQEEAKRYLQQSLAPRAVNDQAPVPSAPADSVVGSEPASGIVIGPDATASFALEQERALEAAAAADMDVLPSLPLCSIYYHKEKSSDQVKGEVEEISAVLLKEASVPEADIVRVDLSRDYELAGFVKAQCKEGVLRLPVLFIRDRMIGGLTELRAALADGSARAQLDKASATSGSSRNESGASSSPPPSSSSPSSPSSSYRLRLGVLDRALEGVESVLSYLNPLRWMSSSTTTTAPDPTHVEFDVVHTNWYWRHLRRRVRFTDTVMLRIHSSVGDVRAVHPYTEIRTVSRHNDHLLVLSYGSGSSPDYLRATPKDIDSMWAILKERASSATFEDLTQAS